MNPPSDVLIEVANLRKIFPVKKNFFLRSTAAVHAVGGVSFSIRRGETLGLVGESGCGKSTTGRCVIRLIEPTGGTVRLEGRDVTALSGKDLRAIRRKMQMVFQDPFSSLNPRQTVDAMLREIFYVHGIAEGAQADRKIGELMEMVGLPAGKAGNFPHEFSGGQRQRIGIARALSVNPSFIVCDEPVSALDVSIQAQIVNLLTELKQKLSLTMLFIAHDLAVVRHISDRIAVMYLGKIVELADARSIYKNPLHPYTQALLSAVPIPDPEIKKQRIELKGDVPSPANIPKGCSFHTRCPHAENICKEIEPELKEIRGHFVSCHLIDRQSMSV